MKQTVIHLTVLGTPEVEWRSPDAIIREVRETLRGGSMVADYDFVQQAIVLRPLEER